MADRTAPEVGTLPRGEATIRSSRIRAEAKTFHERELSSASTAVI